MPALPPLPWLVLPVVLAVAVPPALVVSAELVVAAPEVPPVSDVSLVSEVPLPPEDPVVLAVLSDELDSELEQAVSAAKSETEKAYAVARGTSGSKSCMGA